MIGEVKRIIYLKNPKIHEYSIIKQKYEEISKAIEMAERFNIWKNDIVVPPEPKHPVDESLSFSQIDKVFKRTKYMLAKKKYEDDLKAYNESLLEYKRCVEEKKKQDQNSTYQKLQRLKQELTTIKKRMAELEEEGIKEKEENLSKAKTLKDLNITFSEAMKLIQEAGIFKKIVLTQNDVITENESDFSDASDFVLVHKAAYMPHDSKIRSVFQSKKTHTISISDSETSFSYQYVLGRNTIHFCLNGEVKDHEYGQFSDRKYAIIIPYANVTKKPLSFLDNDTYFDGELSLDGSYILCPESEIEKVQSANPNSIVIGYEGDSVDGYAEILITMLGYKHININPKESKWDVIESFIKKEGLRANTHYESCDMDAAFYQENINKYTGFIKSLIEYKNMGIEFDIVKLILLLSHKLYRISDGTKEVKARNYAFPKLTEGVFNIEKFGGYADLIRMLKEDYDIEISNDIYDIEKLLKDSWDDGIKKICQDDPVMKKVIEKGISDNGKEWLTSMKYNLIDLIIIKEIISQVYKKDIKLADHDDTYSGIIKKH